MLYTISQIVGLLSALASILVIILFTYTFIKNKKEKQPIIKQKVAVIVPCKGIIEDLEKNLQSISHQDYPDYQVIFVLDSKEDPAYPIIEKIIKNTNNASVELSQKIEGSSGKISALISGIKKTDDVDVYVFADSDIKPNQKWLKNLVVYLSEDKVGATTGFRWFFQRNLKTSLISAWNMAGMASLFMSMSNWAWGGSTAIRKKLFEELQIESKWKKGFSDDLILTGAVKAAGYKIRFLPQSVVESSPETNIKKFLKWGTTQFTWVRWYYPFIWFAGLTGMLIIHGLILSGFILIILGFTIQGILMISPVFLEFIFGLAGILVLRKLMNYPKEKFGSIINYVLLMPVVFVLFTYSLILSGVKQEIKWGGKSYSKIEALRNR